MKTLRDPESRGSLQDRLNHLRPDATANWGTMSVDQMLWHLNACLRTALGTLDCVPKDTLLTRTVVKWIALFGPWPPHPSFGPRSGWQWSRLELRHVSYHLRQFGA